MKALRRLFILAIIVCLGISAYMGYYWEPQNREDGDQTPTPTLLIQNGTPSPEPTPTTTPALTPEPTPTVTPVPVITADLVVAGDIVMHMGLYNQSYNSTTSKYDFSYILEDVAPLLSDADYAMACLETTFDGTGNYSGYPDFISPDELAYNLRDAGIDFLSTASNHAVDSGYNGLARTIEVLDRVGISHSGTFTSQAYYDDPVTVVDVGGISVAVVAMTYNTNWGKVSESYAVNYFTVDWAREGMIPDYSRIDYCIAKAQEKNADLIAFYMHWGDEYDIAGNNRQKQVADYLFDHGVTLVLGGHAHVPQPMEYRQVTYPDGTTGTGFLCYCLGNFLSTMDYEYTYDTVLLNIKMSKEAGSRAVIEEVSYTPLYMYDAYDNGNWSDKYPRYQLIDTYKLLDAYESGDLTDYPYANQTLRTKLDKSLGEIRMIMGPELDIRYGG